MPNPHNELGPPTLVWAEATEGPLPRTHEASGHSPGDLLEACIAAGEQPPPAQAPARSTIPPEPIDAWDGWKAGIDARGGPA